MVNGIANSTVKSAPAPFASSDRTAVATDATECPICGRTGTRMYGIFRQGETTTRYHLCDDCGALFHSQAP